METALKTSRFVLLLLLRDRLQNISIGKRLMDRRGASGRHRGPGRSGSCHARLLECDSLRGLARPPLLQVHHRSRPNPKEMCGVPAQLQPTSSWCRPGCVKAALPFNQGSLAQRAGFGRRFPQTLTLPMSSLCRPPSSRWWPGCHPGAPPSLPPCPSLTPGGSGRDLPEPGAPG